MALMAHELSIGLQRVESGRRIATNRLVWAAGLAVLFAALLLDGMLHERAAFDLSGIKAVQQIEGPGIASGITYIETLTSSEGAIAIWLVVVLALSLIRLWSLVVASVLMPVGGVLNTIVGEVFVERTRPHLAELTRTSQNFEERSFPSGHVMGAVLLYGLLFVAARRITIRPVRLLAQGLSLAIIVAVGPARIWEGAHWPSDVIGAYALGGLLLLGLVAVSERLVDIDGLPLIRARNQPHDESVPHAHALTSLVVLQDATVEKIYQPGLLPRVIYWLAFQAPFPYINNRSAMLAAQHRRNLAAQLTAYWYGSPRVARVIEIARRNGQLAVVSERVNGSTPENRAAASAFLADLRGRFEEAGLPTWQIDPRQPRAIDNLLETPDGSFQIVDLESGLVSPLASMTTWKRALKRGMVPFFDDIFFDHLRAYVARETGEMARTMGEDFVAELNTTIDTAEQASIAWHEGERRVWSKALGIVIGGFGIRRLVRRFRQITSGSHEKAMSWMDRAVTRWQEEGRLTDRELAGLRTQMAEPAFQQVIPYFGAHILLSIPLRFPFGSIIRPFIVLGALLVETARWARGRITREEWNRARTIHSPLVMLVAAMPGIGSLAYLASKPVRSNRLMMRVLADAALAKVPWSLYERSKLRRLVTRPAIVNPGKVTSLQAIGPAEHGRLAAADPASTLEAA
jgi:membrane-associated phospholipid phosphatase